MLETLYVYLTYREGVICKVKKKKQKKKRETEVTPNVE